MSEIGVEGLVTVEAAIAVIDASPVSTRVERVNLLDADGRVLAAGVAADRDYPPFDKALMDGYAVRAVDTANGGGASMVLRRVGEIAAGGAGGPLAPGTCVAIMTGAPLPAGADAVIPVERTTADGDAVRLAGPVRPGDAVSPRAAEAAAGRPLLAAGTRLGPAALAVCAQVGAATLDVFARPRVGVLSSGDEVIPFDRTPVGSQIRGSNTVLLAGLLRRYGCDPVDLGHVADDPAAIAAALSTPGLDAALVTGGMSMGVYDYTPRVLRDLGYDLAVTKLRIKPGKPFVFARVGLRPQASGLPPFVFGLPGNPVSAFVCTVRLASRLLLRTVGASPEPAWATAALGHDLPANGPREFYQPATLEAGVARVPAWGGSADLFALAWADALLVRPAGEAARRAGEAVRLIQLP